MPRSEIAKAAADRRESVQSRTYQHMDDPAAGGHQDAEGENETLKNYIIELKQRIAVYIPVKDDPIDKRLAEFINNYPERQRLKIMFMRDSEGVYPFGT